MSALPGTWRPADVPEGWRRVALPLVVVLAVILALHWDTARGMVGIWSRSDTFAHAFVVPPISAWLIWRLRDRLAALQPRAEALWLLPMLGAALLALAGDLVVVRAASQFALVAMLVLAVPALCGTAVARTIFFPLCFLFFAVPIGEFLIPQFIVWTADFTVGALRLSGLPVYREGQQFIIPSGSWSVVEACSGVRYLIASFMVGVLFAYLNYRSPWRRVLFSVVSVIVPIVANWLRAYMIVMLGHLSGNTIAVGADHLVYGWVLFGIVITALFMIGARWAEAPAEAESSASDQALVGSAGRFSSAWGVGLGVLLIAASPHWAMQRLGAGDLPGEPQFSLPASLAGWQASEGAGPAWRPTLANPSVSESRLYTDAQGRVVGLHVGYFRHQDDGRKLVSTLNHLVSPEDKEWNAVTALQRAVALPGRSLELRESELLATERGNSPNREQLRIWQLYWIDGRLVAGHAAAKLVGVVARLMGRGDDGALITLFASERQPGGAEAALTAFAADSFGALEQSLADVRAASAPAK
ncbi:MAG: exosortase A [Burkholderiales bacterium]|nr:exosortase A [Burkholderiales bacterium]